MTKQESEILKGAIRQTLDQNKEFTDKCADCGGNYPWFKYGDRMMEVQNLCHKCVLRKVCSDTGTFGGLFVKELEEHNSDWQESSFDDWVKHLFDEGGVPCSEGGLGCTNTADPNEDDESVHFHTPLEGQFTCDPCREREERAFADKYTYYGVNRSDFH